MTSTHRPKLALVLSGGGARGAYEAGVIHYIRTMLPPKGRFRQFDIHCGASVGALNTCFLVATAHDHAFQAREIRRIWENIKEENIYKRNLKALFHFLSKSTSSLLFKFLKGVDKDSPHFPGFLDTSPFLPFLEKVLPWPRISRNIQQGIVQAISIVATNVFTGRMEFFIDKNIHTDYTGNNDIHLGPIQPFHAAASAAIPIIFPTIMINGIAYTDGGLRLNTPLSPAIHLGADSIFVIGLNHRARPGDAVPMHGELGRPPSVGQVMGRVLNSVFLDRIQYDMEQLERINRIIDWGEDLYGRNFIQKINQLIQKKSMKGDIADRGLKRLNVLRIRPSEDIGKIFSDCFRKMKDKEFTTFEKFLIRLLDIDPNSGVDFLSYISFTPNYLKALLDLGFQDAKSQHHSLKEFMEQ